MAAPTFVSSAPIVSGTGALTVAAAASVVSGDLILIFVESASESVATPSGYTPTPFNAAVGIGAAAAVGAVRLSSFYRFATGADTTTTVADSGNHTVACKVVYRNVYQAVPFSGSEVTYWTSAQTVLSASAANAPRNQSRVIFAVALDRDAASTTPVSSSAGGASLTGWALRLQTITSSGVGGGLAIGDGVLANNGSTGSPSMTLAAASIAVGVLFVLNEAVPASSNTASINVTESAAKDSFAASASVADAVFVESVLTTYVSGNSDGINFTQQGHQDVIFNTGSGTKLLASGYHPYVINVTGGQTNLTLELRSQFRYRKVGDTTWIAVGAEIAQTQPSILAASVITQAGFVTLPLTEISGLLTNTSYEISVFSRFIVTYSNTWAQWNPSTDPVTWSLANGWLRLTKPNNAAINVTEPGADTFSASATVTGSGSGGASSYLAATESGSDTAAIALAPNPAALASINVSESGSDTAALISKDIRYVAWLSLLRFAVSPVGVYSYQSGSQTNINTGLSTAIEVVAWVGAIPGEDVVTPGSWSAALNVNIFYREVGSSTWLSSGTPVTGQPSSVPYSFDGEFFGSGLWTVVAPQDEIIPNSGGAVRPPAFRRNIYGLTANTDYEFIVGMSFRNNDGNMAADARVESGNPFYLPYNPELNCYTYLSKTSVLSASINETGSDSAAIAATAPVGRLASLSVTETGNDSSVVAAKAEATSALSATEIGGDSSAIVGKSISTSALSANESGSDQCQIIANSQQSSTASLAAQESGQDGLVSSAMSIAGAILSAQEQSGDSSAVAANVTASAALAVTEAQSDNLSSSAKGIATASLTISEAIADSALIQAAAVATANLAGQEALSDTSSVAANAPATAYLASLEQGSDTLTALASVQATAALSAIEANTDSAVLSASVSVSALIVATEPGSDGFAASINGISSSTLSSVESGQDIAQIQAILVPVSSTASINAQEIGLDGTSIEAKAIAAITISVSEIAQDAGSIQANVVATAIASAIESGNDTAEFYGSVIAKAVIESVEQGSDISFIYVGAPATSVAHIAAQEYGQDSFYAIAFYYSTDIVVNADGNVIVSKKQDSFVICNSDNKYIDVTKQQSNVVVTRSSNLVFVTDDNQ